MSIPCVCDLVEFQKKVLEKELEEREEHELIKENLREGNFDEGNDVVLENKYKGDIKYEDFGQSTGRVGIGEGG